MTYKQNIQAFKTEIKLIAGYIKSFNTRSRTQFIEETKYTPRGYDTGKRCQSHLARHMHIAYGLQRGRTMKQIEHKCRKGNEPNMKLVERFTEEFMNPTGNTNEPIAVYDASAPTFPERVITPKPPELKMYVLVRKDLEPKHRMVQAGHAIAQYLIKHKDSGWSNGTLIYLAVDNEADLIIWERKIKEAELECSSFIEPDWKEGPTQTAIACVSDGKLFDDLPLLNTREKTGLIKSLCELLC